MKCQFKLGEFAEGNYLYIRIESKNRRRTMPIAAPSSKDDSKLDPIYIIYYYSK